MPTLQEAMDADAGVVKRTVPNQKFLDGALKIPTIMIAGQEWPIPKFAPKQNNVIVPIVMEMSQELIGAMSVPTEQRLSYLAKVLNPEGMKKLNDVVYTALTKAHPDLLRKEYDEEFEVGTMEMVEAFLTIAKQTGLIKIVPKNPAGGAPLPGEGQAASSQTGTP